MKYSISTSSAFGSVDRKIMHCKISGLIGLLKAATRPQAAQGSCKSITDTERFKRLQTKIRQAWVIIRAPAQRPAVLALRFLDRQVVDTRDATAHQAVLVELPILVAIRTEPVARIVVPLIGESYRYTRLMKGP